MFAEAIEQLGIKVKLDFAEDGSILMNMLHDETRGVPDLIFLDLNMPNKTGRECLEMIRREARLKTIPVVIYSTSSSPKDIDETFEGGANLYVRKPYSFKELQLISRKILGLNWDKYKPHTSRSQFLFSVKNH